MYFSEGKTLESEKGKEREGRERHFEREEDRMCISNHSLIKAGSKNIDKEGWQEMYFDVKGAKNVWRCFKKYNSS